MSLSTSSSDQLERIEDAASIAWRHWLVVFCGAFFGIAALLFAFLVLVDPYDTGRFPSFGIVGVLDRSPRTAHASFGRDPQFTASVIGNSSGQLIDPTRLSQGTGLRFTQLTTPGTGPREQLAMMQWVISRHPSYGAFVIITDTSWCSSDPDLPLNYPFPFWLYDGDLSYLANVLSSKSLDRAAWRILIALGLRQPVDPVGYSNYLVGKRVVFVPEPPGSPDDDEGDVQVPPPLPWIERLRTFLAELPPAVGVVLAMPPVYYTSLPPPGSKHAAEIAACKAALAEAVPNRLHSGFLDFRVDTEATRDASDFVDKIHYREKLARYMEERIIAGLRSDSIGAPQADRGRPP
jgi:hypothetical protein